jgi:hypothetical protein
MVIWLRGDEPYCTEFTLEADAVMEKLGIRRTRLTQISGRELRVGRIRKGRYIVPVYRPIDVMEYQSWTRASVTHVKSSSVVQEAADSLRVAVEELTERVDQIVHQLTSSLDETIRQAALSAAAPTWPLLGDFDRRLGAMESFATHHDAKTSRTLGSLGKRLDALTVDLDLVKALSQKTLLDLSEITGLSRLAIEETRSHGQTLGRALAEIEHQLTQEEPPSPPPRRAVSRAHTRRLLCATGPDSLAPATTPGSIRRGRARQPG